MRSEETGVCLLSVTETIDLKTVAATTIYTVPTGKTCILTEAWLRTSDDCGATLDCSIGQSAAPTDFVGTTAGDNLDVAGDVILMKPVPSATPATNKEYAAATAIVFNVAVGATNAGAVAGTLYLFGIEDDA